MLAATAAEEALQGSVTKLVGSIFDSVRAQLESEAARKQRENDLEIEAVVTQLLDDVFATAPTKGGHEQQQQQQQQQPALALAPAPAPAPVPRRSMLDAVGDFMGSTSSLFGGGRQEQAQEQAQAQEEAQAQQEGAQNGSSPPPLPPDTLATEVGEWVADVVGRVFEQARPLASPKPWPSAWPKPWSSAAHEPAACRHAGLRRSGRGGGRRRCSHRAHGTDLHRRTRGG